MGLPLWGLSPREEQTAVLVEARRLQRRKVATMQQAIQRAQDRLDELRQERRRLEADHPLRGPEFLGLVIPLNYAMIRCLEEVNSLRDELAWVEQMIEIH